MLTPGAVMFGFRALSPTRGPPEEKSANARNVGFGISVGVMVMAWPSAARSLARSEVALVNGPLTPRRGIVTVNGTPSSGFDVIGPSKGGSPAALFAITTAAAPACWPKIALATRAQTPRLTT